MQVMRRAGDDDFRLAFEEMHQRIKRRRVLTQFLSVVEGEDCHVTSWLLDNFAADNGAVLVGYQLGCLRDFSAGESFRFGWGVWLHNSPFLGINL